MFARPRVFNNIHTKQGWDFVPTFRSFLMKDVWALFFGKLMPTRNHIS